MNIVWAVLKTGMNIVKAEIKKQGWILFGLVLKTGMNIIKDQIWDEVFLMIEWCMIDAKLFLSTNGWGDPAPNYLYFCLYLCLHLCLHLCLYLCLYLYTLTLTRALYFDLGLRTRTWKFIRGGGSGEIYSSIFQIFAFKLDYILKTSLLGSSEVSSKFVWVGVW